MAIDRDLMRRAISEAQDGNPRLFIESYFSIASKQNTLVPFRFNRIQHRLWNNLTGRDYFLKFRQGGSSVVQLARAAAFCSAIPHYNAAVVTLSTDKGRTKERMFRHVHRFIDTMPEELRPQIGRDRVDYIEFPVLESQMYIGTVGSKEFGRSETIHFLMVTEFGSFTESEAHNVLNSAIESVVPGGIIIFESTPKTVGSAAHKFWQDCKKGLRPYRTHFAPWYWSEEYHLPEYSNEALPADQGPIVLTDEEELIASRFESDGIAVEDRIRWRRAKKADRKEYFFSEYPEDELSCWLSATQSIFDAARLQSMMQDARDPIRVEGPLRVYKERDSLRRYVVGIDAAAGTPTGDYSAAVVLTVETGEVVAVYQGRISDNELARDIADLSMRYGKALVAGEADQWTAPIMEKLEALGVPVLIDEHGRAGFPNTNTSRAQAVLALKTAIREGDFIAYDSPLLEELAQYQVTTNPDSNVEKFGAPKGGDGNNPDRLHDDMCVAAQRAQQIRLTVPGQSIFFPRADANLQTVSTYGRPSMGF